MTEELLDRLIKPVRTGDQIYKILLKSIIDGEISGGEKIIVSKVAEELNTSRTPVKEAVRVLEAEGWVRKEINGTIKVNELSEKKLQELYEIRAVLEGLLTREATMNIKPDEIFEIEEELKTFSSLTDKDDDIEKEDIAKIVASGEKIHELIHAKSSNTSCKMMLEDVQNKIIRYRSLSVAVPGRSKEALEEHLEILDFIRAKKATEAEYAMRRHILNGGETFLKAFMKNNKENL